VSLRPALVIGSRKWQPACGGLTLLPRTAADLAARRSARTARDWGFDASAEAELIAAAPDGGESATCANAGAAIVMSKPAIINVRDIDTSLLITNSTATAQSSTSTTLLVVPSTRT
jgi:hypothetical protein